MKNWITKYFTLVIASLALMSCEKDEDMVFFKEGTTPVLSASTSSTVLNEDNAKEEAVTLTWTPSDFGYQAAVNYTLEMDMKGNDFAAPVSVNLGSGTKKTFTVEELNSLVNRLEIKAFESNNIDMRIVASVSPKVNAAMSKVITMNITPYLTEPPYATLYMIGDATDAGWDNNNAIAMLRDPNDLFKFTYTGKFKAGNLKFLGKRGSWAPMYGAGENNTLAFRATEGDPDPASIMIQSEGYKTVTLDLRSNTYSITEFDASSKPTYSAIGIIGSFNGWSADVLMNKTAFNPHYWTLEHTFTEDVEMKFRLEGNWGTNWGAPAGDQEKLFNNTGGDNIKVAAGTYLIVFNDLSNKYIFIKKD